MRSSVSAENLYSGNNNNDHDNDNDESRMVIPEPRDRHCRVGYLRTKVKIICKFIDV